MPQLLKTGSSTPRLSEYAKHFVYPDGITQTVWPRVVAKGCDLGLTFDWWQNQLGTVCLGYRDDGKYAATIGGIGLSIPRQVGKTYFVLAMLVILCVLFPGLQVVWTAHHLRTSTKTFTTLRGICRRKKVAPLVLAMRSANGEQQVEFRNGSMIMFGARSQGFGRGFDEVDVEVFDEAQILTEKALEDMVAATNQSRHPHGALLFYMGTPPRAADPSEAFTTRRAEALAGKSEDSIWLELSADPNSDPDDRSEWPIMNPSFPTRTPLESLLRLRRNLKDEDSWNREGRGIWDSENFGSAITPSAWAKRQDIQSKIDGSPTFAIDVSPMLTHAAIAVAGKRVDGELHGEILLRDGEDRIDYRPGTEWVVPALLDLKARIPNLTISIVKGSQAESLASDIENAGITLNRVPLADLVAACGLVYKLSTEGGVWHTGQPQLAAAVAATKWRDVGEGAQAWARRKSNADITPMFAFTLAIQAAVSDSDSRMHPINNVW
jgi:hypothetical protein